MKWHKPTLLKLLRTRRDVLINDPAPSPPDRGAEPMSELDQIFVGITVLLVAGLAAAIFGGWIDIVGDGFLFLREIIPTAARILDLEARELTVDEATRRA